MIPVDLLSGVGSAVPAGVAAAATAHALLGSNADMLTLATTKEQ